MGTVYNTNVVTDGLVSSWDAGNRKSYPGTGTTWTDLVSGANGTLTNTGGDGPNFNSEKLGCIEFDGTNDYVDFGSYSPTVVTVDFWIYVDADQGALLYQGDDAYAEHLADWFIWRSGYGLRLVPQGTGSTVYIPASVYYNLDHHALLNSWINIVMVRDYDGSNSIAYVNGVSIGTNTRGTTNAKVFRMFKAGAYYSKGKVGTMRLYDRALTYAEVTQNYEATKNRFLPRVIKSGLVGNWDAGDPQSYSGGTTWKDTVNLVNGTLVNGGDGSLTFDSTNGGCLDFDGTDDYCSGGPVPPSGDSTYSAWCYFASGGSSAKPVFNSSGSTLYLWLGRNSSGKLFLHHHNADNDTVSTVTSSKSLSVDTWYYITSTWDGSSVTLHVNGDAYASTTTGTPTNITNASGIWFGRYNTDYFKGKMSVLQIYNRALTEVEVLENYNATRARFGIAWDAGGII